MRRILYDESAIDREIVKLNKLSKQTNLDKLPSCTFVPWFKNSDNSEINYLILHLPEEHRNLYRNIENSFLFKTVKQV